MACDSRRSGPSATPASRPGTSGRRTPPGEAVGGAAQQGQVGDLLRHAAAAPPGGIAGESGAAPGQEECGDAVPGHPAHERDGERVRRSEDRPVGGAERPGAGPPRCREGGVRADRPAGQLLQLGRAVESGDRRRARDGDRPPLARSRRTRPGPVSSGIVEAVESVRRRVLMRPGPAATGERAPGARRRRGRGPMASGDRIRPRRRPPARVTSPCHRPGAWTACGGGVCAMSSTTACLAGDASPP